MKAAGNFSELIKAVGEKSKKPAEASFLLFYVAGVQGFEPRMAESESAALPLGDTPIDNESILIILLIYKTCVMCIREFPTAEAHSLILRIYFSLSYYH